MREQLQSDFDKTVKTAEISQEEILIKKDFLNKFIESGFPNKKQEDWKFLDISQIIKKDISNLSFFNDYSQSNKIEPSIYINSLDHNKIVFTNGRIEKIDFSHEDQNKIEIIDDTKKNTSFDNKNTFLFLSKSIRFNSLLLTKKKPLSPSCN